MTVSAWRIVKRKLAKAAFSGEGARLYGGRWNRPGAQMVYTAESQSLAALEIVAHVDAPELLADYVVLRVDIEERFIRRADLAKLPKYWRANPPPPELQDVGDAWLASGSSAALQVPSALIPSEHNFLLNPRQPDFAKLRIGAPAGFWFDPRLIK